MQKPFNELRAAAKEAAETIGMALDDSCTVTAEGYEFERYAFKLRCSNGITLELSISGDDIDQFFYGAP